MKIYVILKTTPNVGTSIVKIFDSFEYAYLYVKKLEYLKVDYRSEFDIEEHLVRK
ncbi:hypothetical protein [Tetragenococcus halophilus]|uniref:hypothetical protein n=1 Tax=Tetragenococcus halophilus TaxID=51669 RepID=UPI002A9B5990|nr:hypothetical protein TEHSL10_11710 [Tetragenococcus halophilus]